MWLLFQHGNLLCQLAEDSRRKGDLHKVIISLIGLLSLCYLNFFLIPKPQAVELAQEGLKMRYSLLNHMYEKDKINADENGGESSYVSSSEGKIATFPAMVHTNSDSLREEEWKQSLSQWRIVSDYLEVLMLVGYPFL